MITYANVQDGFNLDLADFSNIVPEKHRATEQRMLDYLYQFAPLHTGSFHVGNVPNDTTYFTITIPNVGTSSYYVLGSLRSNGSDYNKDLSVIWQWREPTATSFIFTIKELANFPQDLTFFYEIKKIIV